MLFTKLIPNVFYIDINDGIDLFVNCLDFKISYNDLQSAAPCCVVEKDNLAFFLHENEEYALKDRPEFRLHTPDINAVYTKVKALHPQYLHPNLNKPTLRPWGATEFALKDATNVCIIIQQW